MKIRKRLLILAAMLLPTINTLADSDKDYREYAEQVRKEIWQEKRPEFEQKKCPDKYKSHSAVILAAYSELSADYKRRMKAYDFFVNRRLTRKISSESCYRELVAINDANALKEYSEFDFSTSSKSYYYDWRKDETKVVLGIKIIKPDGTVKEVGTDDYVIANQGKKGKEKRQKLAVPGLQVGDLIDLFVFKDRDIEEMNLDPFVFRFAGEHPILSYKVHCVVDPALTTQYRTLNGAPDFTQSTDENKNIVLDAAVSNVETTTPNLWYIDKSQTPQTLMYIIGKKMMATYDIKSIKKKGLQANPDPKTIQEDVNYRYKEQGTYVSGDSKVYTAIRYGIKLGKTDLPDIEKANRLFHSMSFAFKVSQYDYSTECILKLFATRLEKMGIENEFCMTTTTDNEPIDKLIYFKNATWGVKLKNSDTFFFPSNYPKVPSEIDQDLQGRKYVLYSGAEGTLPAGSPDDNKDKATLNVKIDGTTLHIDRTHSLTGTTKEFAARRLATMEDYMNKLVELTDGDKDKDLTEAWGKKYKADAEEAFRKGREQERKDYDTDVEYYHGAKAKSVDSYRTVCLGCSSDSAAFIYNVVYNMDGYVKKAGNNLILSAGQLIGEQLKIEGSDRERTADIMRQDARAFEWDINVQLPTGYTVSDESLSKLNANVSTNFGSFEAKATTADGQLKLHVTKRYNKPTASVSEWPDILKFIDSCNDYTAQQVVLKK